jgi:predicted transposase/invertase (TIGR01784 family)
VKERPLISFDYAVKYLLRSKTKDDYAILGGFLSELMGRRVKVIDILESETNKVDADEKTNRVDIKAQIDTSTPLGDRISTPLNDRGGEFAVFEIQFSREYDFFARVLFGVSKAVTEQVKSGETKYNINKVYSINIAYSNMTAKREYLFYGRFSGFQGVHFKEESIPFAQTVDEKSKDLIDIHPEYYLILPGMFDDELRGKFDEWVYILKHTAAREDFTAAGIEEAKVKLDLLTMPPNERKAYERYLENRSSLDCAIITAKADGWNEGLAEAQKKIVLNMHNKGYNIQDIAEATELSVDKINDIVTRSS